MYRCAYNAKVKLFERNISLQNNSHSLNHIFCCILLHEIHRAHFTSLCFGVQDMRWRYYDGFTKLDKTSYYSVDKVIINATRWRSTKYVNPLTCVQLYNVDALCMPGDLTKKIVSFYSNTAFQCFSNAIK